MTQTWEQHWTKLDDGSGRSVSLLIVFDIEWLLRFFSSVPQEKFVEYVTSSDDYKQNFDRALV